MAALMIGSSSKPELLLPALAFVLAFVAITALTTPAQGHVFHVGGPRGWRVPDANTSYGWWAMNNRFHVADELCESSTDLIVSSISCHTITLTMSPTASVLVLCVITHRVVCVSCNLILF